MQSFNDSLYKACVARNQIAIIQIVNLGGDPTAVLPSVCKLGYIDSVQQLCNSGADARVAVPVAIEAKNLPMLANLMCGGAPESFVFDEICKTDNCDFFCQFIEYLRGEDSVSAALISACELGKTDFIIKMTEKYVSLNRAIYFAAKHRAIDAIHRLVEMGASLRSAMRGAVEGRHNDIRADLIRRGANPEYARHRHDN